MCGGVNSNNNSISQNINLSNYREGTAQNLQNLLTNVGFKSSIENGHITISSDVPYPAVKKSKFLQIYDKAKDKIQGVFAKLKSLVNSKDQVKESNQDERE